MKMKRVLILIGLLLSVVSVNAFGWEMYVSNEGTNSITVYNEVGQLIDTIPLDARPNQSFFRTNGNLYVACSINSSKIVIIQDHNVVGSFYPPGGVNGMAIGANNHFYAGRSGNLINEYDENDNFVKSFAGVVATAMAVGPNGNLYIVTNGTQSVSEVDLNGNILNQFSTGQGSYPRGIAFGPDGYIYVSRDLYNDIGVYNPNTFALERTITGVTNPYGLAFNPHDNHLYVVSFSNNSILEFLYTGQ
jgi:DNA-binding beta-propeller fold protein YncE